MELTKLVASNIRALRKYMGETQKELGSYIGVSDSEISNYEKENRGIDIETLSKISNHYGVSVIDLLTWDFGDVGKVETEDAGFREEIENEFPIITTEKTKMNKAFMAASLHHADVFRKIKDDKTKSFDPTLEKMLENCINDYKRLLKDSEIIEEVAANLVGLEQLYLMLVISELMRVVNKIDSNVDQIPKIRDIRTVFDECYGFKDNEAIGHLLKCLNYPVSVKHLTEHTSILMKSAVWHELGAYYVALQYAYGIVDNESDPMMNYRVGLEMLSALDLVGNPYAHREMMDFS